MWIVKNVLRGTLRFPGLEISIPPRSEFDLDQVLPRHVSENSNQLQVAFEEGYLQNIRKDAVVEPSAPTQGSSSTLSGEDLERTLESFKNKIIEEIRATLPLEIPQKDEKGSDDIFEKLEELKENFAGNLGNLSESLEEIKKKIREEKHRVLEDQALSGAELRARLKFLEEQEDQLVKNFDRLGKTSTSTRDSDDKGLMEKADLLSDL
ncbi:MAG: hypothetical protein D6785_00250 [Planctomycetota bacterium]|nr:MAG: hypothetical protein D6785_00250 [Planctomycetota bacterium]